MTKHGRLSLAISVILLTIVSISITNGQTAERTVIEGIPVNYDEEMVGSYTLPDPLRSENGRTVRNAKQWMKKRRPEILALFEQYQYGTVPPVPEDLSFDVFDKGTMALNGTALRKQVRIYFTKDTSKYRADVLIYLPADAVKPVPVFLNVGFFPNSGVADDPGIRTGYMWSPDGKRIPAKRRGGFGMIDLNQFLSQGIGYANVCYSDIEPDFGDGYKFGIRGHYLKEGQDYPAPDEWGAISAWSWGLSRVMDYLQTDPQIEAKKVALFGVSRLGKTVLWTGARDQRFGMVIASCSGEGGAALSRRIYGETIDHMTHPKRYLYQFAGNWRNYREDPSKSPVDAHMLIALMAPRPLLLQTGDKDKWSDPKGEFLAAAAAGPVYELLGKKSLGTDEWPAPGVPVLNDLGYFMHTGDHGVLPGDYEVFIQFIKKHFFEIK